MQLSLDSFYVQGHIWSHRKGQGENFLHFTDEVEIRWLDQHHTISMWSVLAQRPPMQNQHRTESYLLAHCSGGVCTPEEPWDAYQTKMKCRGLGVGGWRLGELMFSGWRQTGMCAKDQHQVWTTEWTQGSMSIDKFSINVEGCVQKPLKWSSAHGLETKAACSCGGDSDPPGREECFILTDDFMQQHFW